LPIESDLDRWRAVLQGVVDQVVEQPLQVARRVIATRHGAA
jgi:hypothetical protein